MAAMAVMAVDMGVVTEGMADTAEEAMVDTVDMADTAEEAMADTVDMEADTLEDFMAKYFIVDMKESYVPNYLIPFLLKLTPQCF